MNKQDQQHWVFAYGSLMWRPGFQFIEKCPATLLGYSRSLCVYSHIHRGTPEKPGLVFGLDKVQSNDMCQGIAYRIEDENWNQTVEYLREREQVTAVYIEDIADISLTGENQFKTKALTYRVDRNHKQYAGQLNLDEQLKFIRQGHGQSGDCREYVLSTAEHLLELDVEDKNLQALAKALA